MMIQTKPHVALLASPGLGHLIPILELAKCLATKHGLIVTIIAVTNETHQIEDELLHSVSSSCPDQIHTIILPIDKLIFSGNETILTRLSIMMRTALPSLHSLIHNMKHKPIALIVDQFGVVAFEKIAQDFNMFKYVFIASNARYLSYALYFPYVDYNDRGDYFRIPGCEPIPWEELNNLSSSPDVQDYREFVRIVHLIESVDGILVNTWEDIEAKTLLAFRDEKALKSVVKAPVYAIGPVIRRPCNNLMETEGVKSKLIKWLDDQPNESVVYVSFGSGGTLTTQQTIELALGLELSKQRFIWVVRPPIDNNNAACLFESVGSSGTHELNNYLPDGFLDRTRDLGFIVPMWAPQSEILSHASIGVFVSHCGWNSSLESITNGVPIIAWPLYAEQDMNATMLVKNLGIAVRWDVNPQKELVKRDEIANMVRRVMVDKEGIGIKTRVSGLKASANIALREGGSSYNALSQVVKKIVE
ncbi:unnamed protein product [Amaranthus hypochondriacus]